MTQSRGRGGAGNFSPEPVTTVPADELETPTIKSNTYTTGRGGSGNMATHSSAEEKRAAQDVEAPAHHQSKPEGTYHWGRGGEGNMMTIGKNGKEEKKERTPSTENNGRSSGSFHDAFEKGKEMLGLKKVEKDKAANGSAIADD